VVSEEQAAVRDLVNALDDDERDLLALRVAAGLSAEEVGAVIGKSAGAVRVGVHRLIKRLRGDLRRWMDSDDSEEDAR
jgi:RNA polymerase sigma-70 factor (ECF subfamily)